ncbi:alpha/beta hydrolase [soil metagenome]
MNPAISPCSGWGSTFGPMANVAGAATDLARSMTLLNVFKVPAPVIRRLAGKPVVVDGVTLDPEMQLLLKLRALEGPPPEDLPLSRARRAIVAGSRLVSGRRPIGSVTDRVIEGPGGELTLRFYTPRGLTGVASTLFFLHGGGWMYGSLESHDGICRYLAEEAQVRVIAVDYRLAPEHPFPAGFEDAWAAYEWVIEHAKGIGVDPTRVAVGGDSAGGNFAAVIAQEAVRRGVQAPAFQLLIYPATDFTVERPSRATYSEGYYLSAKFMEQARENYLVGDEDLADRRLSPLCHDARGVAPAYVVTAGFDPLRDEGKAYADALGDAGVPVEYVCHEGLIHSFAHMVGLGRSAPKAMRKAAAALQRGLS